MVIRAFFLFLGVSVTLGVSARTWADNFDSYTNGQFLDGGSDDGGWKGWDNTPHSGVYVMNVQSFSSPNSVDINGTKNLVHEYSGYTTSKRIYRCIEYVPTDFNGLSSFILLSDHLDGAGQNNKWALVINFDSTNQVVESYNDLVTAPLSTGEWVDLGCERKSTSTRISSSSIMTTPCLSRKHGPLVGIMLLMGFWTSVLSTSLQIPQHQCITTISPSFLQAKISSATQADHIQVNPVNPSNSRSLLLAEPSLTPGHGTLVTVQPQQSKTQPTRTPQPGPTPRP